MTDDYKERANQVSMGDSTEVSEGELEWMEDNVPSARHLVADLRSTKRALAEERKEAMRVESHMHMHHNCMWPTEGCPDAY